MTGPNQSCFQPLSIARWRLTGLPNLPTKAPHTRFTRWLGCPVTECDYHYWGDENVEHRPGQGGVASCWPYTGKQGGVTTASTVCGSGRRLVQ